MSGNTVYATRLECTRTLRLHNVTTLSFRHLDYKNAKISQKESTVYTHITVYTVFRRSTFVRGSV